MDSFNYGYAAKAGSQTYFIADIGLAVIFMTIEGYCDCQGQPSEGLRMMNPSPNLSTSVREAHAKCPSEHYSIVANTGRASRHMYGFEWKAKRNKNLRKEQILRMPSLHSFYLQCSEGIHCETSIVKEMPKLSSEYNTVISNILTRMKIPNYQLSPTKLLAISRGRDQASQQLQTPPETTSSYPPRKGEGMKKMKWFLPSKSARMEMFCSHLEQTQLGTPSIQKNEEQHLPLNEPVGKKKTDNLFTDID